MVNYSENDRWTFHAYSDRLFPRSFGWNSSFFIALPRRIAKKSNLKTSLNSREQIIKNHSNLSNYMILLWEMANWEAQITFHGSILWDLEFIPFPSVGVQQSCKFNLMFVMFRCSGSMSLQEGTFPTNVLCFLQMMMGCGKKPDSDNAQNNHPQPWNSRHHVMNPTYRS